MLTTFFREEHEIFRKTLRDWVAKELAPYVNEWEKAELFPREIFKKAGEMGFLGASYPEDVGGSAGDWWYTAVWGEELVRSGCAGVNMALAVALGFRPMSESEQQQLLARTATPAADGRYERFKTSDQFDGTAKHPKWLETASL